MSAGDARGAGSYVVRYFGAAVRPGRGPRRTITTSPLDLAAAAAFVGARPEYLAALLRRGGGEAQVGEMSVVERARGRKSEGLRRRESFIKIDLADAREVVRHWRSCGSGAGADAFGRLVLALHDAGGDT